MQEIDIQIRKLKLFPDSMLSYQEGLSESEIERAEKTLKISLPPDLKYFYYQINGFSLMGELVYPLLSTGGNFSVDEDLVKINYREHFEVVNPMPEYFLAFAPNGRGDHYCLDLRSNVSGSLCPVIFWQWDYSFFNPADIDKTHDSFSSWLTGLLLELEEEL